MNHNRLALVVVATLLLATTTRAADAPDVDAFLSAGKLADGEKVLADHLQRTPDDETARFGLGVVQFLRSLERLMQSLHANGLRGNDDGFGQMIPVARLPVPSNPDPKVVSYDDARAMLQAWQDDLKKVDATLAGIKDGRQVKLPVRFGLVRLDFDGDGKATDAETLWRIFARVQPRAGVNEKSASEFAIAFDGGDALWLRGYCHLLSALCDVALAYDAQELWDHTAHVFFKKPKTPFDYLRDGPKPFDVGFSVDVTDAIAIIHLLRFPLKEPQRMQSALGHLKQMTAMSRQSWKLILAEEDNDREWIPNPKQQTVIPRVRVTAEMVNNWLVFLDEFDQLLDGKRLAPFWRAKDGRGVNINRVFTQPTKLDVVLWFQGTAATPYLEKGELTRPDVWRNLVRVFGGDFFGFAVWFN